MHFLYVGSKLDIGFLCANYDKFVMCCICLMLTVVCNVAMWKCLYLKCKYLKYLNILVLGITCFYTCFYLLKATLLVHNSQFGISKVCCCVSKCE